MKELLNIAGILWDMIFLRVQFSALWIGYDMPLYTYTVFSLTQLHDKVWPKYETKPFFFLGDWTDDACPDP